jgi:hypothetical protein
MAQKFLTNIDLNQNQLIKGTFEVLGADPSTDLFDGRMYFNSGDGVIKIYDATAAAWRKIVAGYGEQAGVIAGGSHSTALTIAESNGQITITPNLANSASAGLMSASDFTKLGDSTPDATANKIVQRDGSGNAKVATPTDSAHIATKGYVDAARQGLDVKQSVRVATTGSIDPTTDLQAGDVIDGVTLASGDRVLVKNQVGGALAQNGIYVAVTSGAASRSSDANGTADTGELKSGTFTFVEEGSVNSDKGFVVSTNGAITIDSTGIEWTQFSGAGSFTAGDGISQSGNTINVNVVADRTAITGDAVDIASTYVGQSTITTLGTITTGVWNGTDVAVADGGTGASDAANARLNLGIKTSAGAVTTTTSTLSRVAAQACAASAGGTSTTTVTHNFNTLDVSVQIVEVSTGATVYGDVLRSNADTISVTLLGTITAGDYRIVVTG